MRKGTGDNTLPPADQCCSATPDTSRTCPAFKPVLTFTQDTTKREYMAASVDNALPMILFESIEPTAGRAAVHGSDSTYATQPLEEE